MRRRFIVSDGYGDSLDLVGTRAKAMRTPCGFRFSRPYLGPDGTVWMDVTVSRWRVWWEIARALGRIRVKVK